MIKNIRILALVVATMLCSLPLLAQNTKFGHVNSQELLSMLPEIKSADTALQKYQQTLEMQLRTMMAEYQSKEQKFTSEEASMDNTIKQVRQRELAEFQQRIQDFQQDAQENMQKKKEELYSPILKRAEDAIKQVAKENNYAYIFDTTLGSAILYAQDSDDITALVKKKLGLGAPPATTPAPVKPTK